MNLILLLPIILVTVGVIVLTTPLESEAQTLESRYAFDIYLVFDDVNRDSAIQVKDAFKTKSETYPLKEHLQNWTQVVEKHNGRDLAILNASFTFDSKADCIAFYNWILNNMPQSVRDDILYGQIMVLDNTHHYPDDQIKGDVIIFENTIGSLDDANFEN